MRLQYLSIVSFIVLGLTSCSNQGFWSASPDAKQTSQLQDGAPPGQGVTPGALMGGSIGQSMDEIDRTKMSHALDKSPGKSTDWVNANTGTHYSITPLQKVSVQGNPYCRTYQAQAERGDNKQSFTGTACVATDGSWSEARS